MCTKVKIFIYFILRPKYIVFRALQILCLSGVNEEMILLSLATVVGLPDD